MRKSNYTTNIFINCPFDIKYKTLLDAAIFAILYCGFNPRCALENNDSGTIRFNKIVKIIKESAFGIHDLSRTELDKKTKLPRFNMPLELGVFLGAIHLGDKKQQSKKCLILDVERYRYQKFISDIAGNDIHAHNNNDKLVITCIRNWLSDASHRKNIPGASEIIRQFSSFKKRLPIMCKKLPINVNELTFKDTTYFVENWLNNLPNLQPNL